MVLSKDYFFIPNTYSSRELKNNPRAIFAIHDFFINLIASYFIKYLFSLTKLNLRLSPYMLRLYNFQK